MFLMLAELNPAPGSRHGAAWPYLVAGKERMDCAFLKRPNIPRKQRSSRHRALGLSVSSGEGSELGRGHTQPIKAPCYQMTFIRGTWVRGTAAERGVGTERGGEASRCLGTPQASAGVCIRAGPRRLLLSTHLGCGLRRSCEMLARGEDVFKGSG